MIEDSFTDCGTLAHLFVQAVTWTCEMQIYNVIGNTLDILMTMITACVLRIGCNVVTVGIYILVS